MFLTLEVYPQVWGFPPHWLYSLHWYLTIKWCKWWVKHQATDIPVLGLIWMAKSVGLASLEETQPEVHQELRKPAPVLALDISSWRKKKRRMASVHREQYVPLAQKLHRCNRKEQAEEDRIGKTKAMKQDAQKQKGRCQYLHFRDCMAGTARTGEAALVSRLQEDAASGYIHAASLIQRDGRDKIGSKIWLLCPTDHVFTFTHSSGLPWSICLQCNSFLDLHRIFKV